MRNIKFRGIRKDTNEFVYGNLVELESPLECFGSKEESKWFIVKTGFADWSLPRQLEQFEIIPETRGQFIGHLDKNGKEIYEGDIIEYSPNVNYLIEWYDSCSAWFPKLLKNVGVTYGTTWKDQIVKHKIIGNRYQNPELITNE